jgi:DNA-binding transcriptional LysR family regulator
MSLSALSTFLLVAERQSFSAAAAALGISRSAVSQAVQGLERSLGTSLFVRTTRSVRLTDAGARLFATAGPALQQANDALAAVRAGEQETSGTVRITVPHIAVPVVVSPALPTLRARFPKLTIEIVADDRLTDIVTERFDAGIRLDERLERHMVSVRVSKPFRFLVVASPRYLAAHGRPTHPRDLMEHECIGYRGATLGVLYRWEFERRGREITVQVPSNIITSDAALGVRAAVDGLGFAYCDEFSAAPYLARKELEVVLEDYLVRVPGLFLYFPERSRTQPKLRALIDVLRVR